MTTATATRIAFAAEADVHRAEHSAETLAEAAGLPERMLADVRQAVQRLADGLYLRAPLRSTLGLSVVKAGSQRGLQVVAECRPEKRRNPETPAEFQNERTLPEAVYLLKRLSTSLTLTSLKTGGTRITARVFPR